MHRETQCASHMYPSFCLDARVLSTIRTLCSSFSSVPSQIQCRMPGLGRGRGRAYTRLISGPARVMPRYGPVACIASGPSVMWWPADFHSCTRLAGRMEVLVLQVHRVWRDVQGVWGWRRSLRRSVGGSPETRISSGWWVTEMGRRSERREILSTRPAWYERGMRS